MFTFKRNQIIITVLVFMIAIAAYLNTKDGGQGVQPNLVQDTDTSKDAVAEEKDFFEGYNDIQELPPDADSALSDAVVDGKQAEAAVNDQKTADGKAAAGSESAVNTKTEADGKKADVVKADQSEQNAVEASAEVPQKFEAIITKKDAVIADAGSNSNVTAEDKNLDVSYFAEEKMLREQNRALQVEQLKQYVANENLDKEAKSKAAANLLAIQERIEKESSAEALLRAKGFKEVYVRIDENSVDVVINKDNLTESDIAQIEEIVNRKTGYSVGKIKITPLKGIVKENANQ